MKTKLISLVLILVVCLSGVSFADGHRMSYRGYDVRGSHGHCDYRGGNNYYSGYRNERTYIYAGLGVAALGLATAVIAQPQQVVVQQQERVVYTQPQQVVYPTIIRETPQVVVVQQPAVVQPVTMIINVQNSNGSMIPVAMKQVGNQWVGPRGEYYDNLPTVGDLRGAYGF